MLLPEVQNRINQWLTGAFDEDTKNTIRKLVAENNETELTDAFYKDLEFGTGGMRGLMGVGTNKMNKYTVAMATQGLFNYLKLCFPAKQIKVAIAYDSRNNSRYFAEISAEVLSANGAIVYLFRELRPTPELSFAVRHFHCHSGIVITASHNPKEYNGYKAYFNDGAQMVSPHDKNTIGEVRRIKGIEQVKFGKISDNIIHIGEDIDNEYIAQTASLSISKEAIQKHKDLKIVFTPLHGTGITLVPKLLQKFGFENIILVEQQSKPDGNFPTTKSPNPEEKEALALALDKAQNTDADLVLATDPDSDRVGIAVKNDKSEWILLNGNQTGALLFHYMLNAWQMAGKLDGKQFIVKTIVTSYLMDKIAASFGVECYNVLTGFKYIAELIHKFDKRKTFIVGGEESYGYLVGDFVRDKDAISACAFIAEMAAYAKSKDSSLYDMLLDIYVQHGYYKEKLVSITKTGKAGADEIRAMMVQYRNHPPKVLGGSKLLKLLDYEQCRETDLATGNTKPIGLPKSDVLQFLTDDGTLVSARPSGTEPKIKFYVSVNGTLPSRHDLADVGAKLDQKIASVLKDLGLE
ncbi:MAG: phospho-sugar mutase [Cytophagales bacterium]|nr:phospho-sugar mutase [Cytophagales bacterium]